MHSKIAKVILKRIDKCELTKQVKYKCRICFIYKREKFYCFKIGQSIFKNGGNKKQNKFVETITIVHF